MFTLIRVHRQQVFGVQDASAEILLQQLKWPIETLFVGMKIDDYNSNSEATRRLYLDRWHRFAKITYPIFNQTGFETYKKSVLTGDSIIITAATGVVTGTNTLFDTELAAGDFLVVNGHPYRVNTVTNATSLDLGAADQPLPPANVTALAGAFYKYSVVPTSANIETCVPTVASVSITAHGVPIYNDFPSQFFNAYMPYHYGGNAIKTPEDCGAMMIPFNIYPGTYQPSGRKYGRRWIAISA